MAKKQSVKDIRGLKKDVSSETSNNESDIITSN